MNIQSISIVVPTRRCVNNCKFCVSKMHDAIAHGGDGFDKFAMKKRIRYAQINSITSCIITGTAEALQNRSYLLKLSELFKELDHPFPNVEIQTTGVFLTYEENGKYLNIELLKELGVNTISLSVSDLFDDERNAEIISLPEKERFILSERIAWLKEFGFNIRLSLNMTKYLNDKSVEEIFERLNNLKVDQVTFRKLWYDSSTLDLPETQWILENAVSEEKESEINNYIIENGKFLYVLPYGSSVYSINGISTVIDSDCMSKQEYKDSLKYVILQTNNKLYCQWDDPGSLIL